MIRRFDPHWWLPMLAVLLAGCASAPNLPEPVKTATVVVHVHDPAPAWATDALPKPALASPTVAGHLAREAALDATVDLANCARRLLKDMGDGKPVDPKACQSTP